MMARKLAVALVLGSMTAAMSACAIGPGPVVSHGKAERVGQRPNQISSKDLMRPDRPRDAVDLVERYLKAAADKPDTQAKTLLSYMEDKSWTPSGEIYVYRVYPFTKQGQIGNIIPVSVPMQKVGKLLKDGRIEPDYDAGRVEMAFSVVDGSDGYLLKDAPRELMLSDVMLQSEWYEARPVYFWDKAGTRLIPDIRYVPPYATEPEKARLLVESLFAGPSPWLSQAVRPLTVQVTLRTIPVYSTDGTMSIDLPSQLGEEELSRLATQLDKTLRVGQVSNVQLKIQGVPVQPGRSEVTTDPTQAARFAVRQDKVVRLDSGSQRAASALPLRPEINVNVQWAMFSRNEESVAISRKDGSFLIGPSLAPWHVAMPTGRSVDQAVWLEGASRAALVLSNGTLYEVAPRADTTPATLIGSLPGPVTSFSVVPDGRIALVIDNKLYMAALYHGTGGLTVTQPQRVPTAFDKVRHVAMAQFNTIVLAGVTEKNLVLTRINIDGALQSGIALQSGVWKDYGDSEEISRLVADYRTGAAYYDYQGRTQQLGPGGATPVRESEVVPAPGATPSPSASPAATAPLPISAASFEG